MTRGWWGWTGRHGRATAPVAPEQPTTAPEVHPEPLRAPRGHVVWLCQLPSGIEPSIHDTESQAANRAALYDGAVIWPVTIETQETA